jgi:uncharacterized membrane protein YgdD (TMEM256/DUF423 family)
MERTFALFGALSGFLGVAAGAFGGHALKQRLSPELQAIFEVGVRYHLTHALALFAAAWACGRWPGTPTTAAGWLFLGGTVLFSGSLYVLALSGVRWWGAITPLGGLALLGGWLALAWAAYRQ